MARIVRSNENCYNKVMTCSVSFCLSGMRSFCQVLDEKRQISVAALTGDK
ncbi:hypothetical protein QS257_16675 [Terrilactibacillus sp. S3-3]|nr:hypothetical protein QS257_16675 [Terrilactibacillus sp. S3-3]